MNILKFLITVIGGYLLGSLSVSIFLSRLLGGDIRKKGSGNAGATNMARIYGIAVGVVTLLGDALKGAAAILLGWLLLGDVGLAAGGIAVLLGHCFPVFHNFHGGKGISVGAAIGLAVDWRVFLAIACAFLIGALLTKKVSVGSVCAALCITPAALFVGVSMPRLVLCVVGMVLVVYQHRENIKRVILGTEPDFKAASRIPSFGKKKKRDA